MRPMHFVVALTCIATQGCGWISQSVISGWSHEERRVSRHQHRVHLSPTPETASIYRVEEGVDVLVGTGATDAMIEYEVEERYRVNESMKWLFIGGFVDALAAVAGIVLLANSDIGTAGKVVSITFGSMIGLALPVTEWTFSGVFAFQNDELLSRDIKQTSAYYVARAPEYRDMLVEATGPGPARVELKLMPAPLAIQTPARPERELKIEPEVVKGPGKVVAVMEVLDVSKGDTSRAIDPLLRKNIGDQLRVFVGAGGFRTVDRSSQQTMLDELINDMKSETYRSCYDETCQIELGKALAAQFILRSAVTRFGDACVLNGELIDLTREVVVAAGSARGVCEPEGFFGMTEQLAKKIVSKAR